MSIHNILVPTDFSEHSAQALEHACELARAFSATVHPLHSFFFVDMFAAPGQVTLPRDFIESVRAGAQEQLEALQKRLTESGVACKWHLSPRDPASAILETARSIPADLIVMGTRGLTGLKHAFLGSVAERTVRLAPCPVLTVKASGTES